MFVVRRDAVCLQCPEQIEDGRRRLMREAQPCKRAHLSEKCDRD